MAELPKTLEAAIAQAQTSTRSAIEAGVSRIIVDLAFPELQIMPVAQQFYPLFQEMGVQFSVFFPDAGAAALAKRDWDNPDFTIRGIGELRGQLSADDELFLVVEPSAVEVEQVEKLVENALGRPVVILNPKLEDVAIIGIGYAGRQLRDRFLSTLETSYYLKPLDGAALHRAYPAGWQIWQEAVEGDYALLAELPQRPSGEVLDRVLAGQSADETEESAAPKSRKGFLGELQQFIRALTQ
ncbi:DUF1995 family protein [Sphaerothrix gracilis]|uniref:DUF1995 family protein n=1 Tax=Sphaerothrix gracilis TaxID=3151835 RepID=UPI0031FE3872